MQCLIALHPIPPVCILLCEYPQYHTDDVPLIQWLPNQLQAVLSQMLDVSMHCNATSGKIADIMDKARMQQNTLKKEVEKYCMERSVPAV